MYDMDVIFFIFSYDIILIMQDVWYEMHADILCM